jgi:hypothetical protein
MSTPTPKTIAGIRPSVVVVDELRDLELGYLNEREAKATPKPKPRKERSAPVRNPAFRESEALKDLQRKLHSEARNK